MKLTTTDDEFCTYIAKFYGVHRYPPSVRELAAHFGLSVSRTHDRLRELDQRGRITRAPHLPRTLRVVPRHGHDDVVIELTVRISRALYQTETEFLEAGRMAHNVAERAINKLTGCQVWGHAKADAGEAW